MADMLISELRRALKETADQATANTHNAAELEVQLRKEILEAHHRLAELEPAWNTFIAKHKEEEDAREQEQRRRAAVAAQPSERRNRGLEYVSNRVDLLAILHRIRLQTLRTWRHLAARTTSCLARLSQARHRCQL